VTVDEGGFSSLDQGFDDQGEQIWGPEATAYDFRRRADPAKPNAPFAMPKP
jgi:hypothetical protein